MGKKYLGGSSPFCSGCDWEVWGIEIRAEEIISEPRGKGEGRFGHKREGFYPDVATKYGGVWPAARGTGDVDDQELNTWGGVDVCPEAGVKRV